jgi:16S rRNA (uracil1498-N3)-methyltransferase
VATIDATPLPRISTDGVAALACVIGPEGGLGPRDLSALDAAKAERVHLGERIVPSRLAGFMAVSLILGARGELDRAPVDTRMRTATVSS